MDKAEVIAALEELRHKKHVECNAFFEHGDQGSAILVRSYRDGISLAIDCINSLSSTPPESAPDYAAANLQSVRRFEQASAPEPNDEASKSDYWSVTVSRGGEPIVTIEPEMLSGREISEQDEKAIREAALNLLAFIGDPAPASAPEPSDDAIAASAIIRKSVFFEGSTTLEFEIDATKAAEVAQKLAPTARAAGIAGSLAFALISKDNVNE